MKYCPYCGAGLLSSTFSFCPECGTKLPTQEEIMAASIDEVINHPESITVEQTSNPRKKSSREKRSAKASSKHRQARSVATPEPPPSDEYYDGYYDDVMPPDLDREKDIIAYLSSGKIKGIGKRTAEKIYEAFGDSTLNILDQEPRKILNVEQMFLIQQLQMFL